LILFAKDNNFLLPIIDKPEINALELKGLSFVFNDDGIVFNHYLMLNKFWELNQYEHCTYDIFKDKKIKNITTKEDGFLITFIMLPSGDIISQTKKGYDSYENILANEYISKPYYYIFIKDCLLNNIQPIFELVGENSFVKYKKPDLILTKIRCNKTGKYLNIKDYNTYDISVVKEYNDYDLNNLLELKESVKNIEGWIVHFEDDTLLKVKTNWWINKKKNKNETL